MRHAAFADKSVRAPRCKVAWADRSVRAPRIYFYHIRVGLASAEGHADALADAYPFRKRLWHRIIEEPVSGDICSDTNDHTLC